MEHNFITTGERSDMDTKKLREILENLLLIFKHREYTNIIKSDEVIDQAIKEIQELCRLITYDDIFCRLRNIYLDKIYTDKPHGLSDKDIGLLARGVEALLPDEPRLMEECPTCIGKGTIKDYLMSDTSALARTCPQCSGTGKKPSVRSSQ